jgi:hypothetical protein
MMMRLLKSMELVHVGLELKRRWKQPKQQDGKNNDRQLDMFD